MSFSGNLVRLERFSGNFGVDQLADLTSEVGPFVEFSDTRNADLPGGIVELNADINIGGAAIIFQIDEVRSFNYGNVDGFNGYVISDADGNTPPITAVSLIPDTNSFELPADRIFFNEDKVFIDLNGLGYNSGDGFQLQIGFGQPGAQTSIDDALFVARLYTATFGRDPDPVGLTFWINQFEALGENDLVNRFLVSGEFEDRFGAPEELSSLEFVQQMYLNVLGRAGEQAGIEFWTGLLEQDRITKRDALEFFVTAPENVDNTTRFDEGIAQNAATGDWIILG